jgi:hypothetical protein
MLYEFIFEPAPRLRQHRRKVGFGVKLGSGGGFQLGLFYPQQQTFAARANTSVLCQLQTNFAEEPSGEAHQ